MSLQLRTYFQLRARGVPVEEAAERAGLPITEAKLWEDAVARGETSFSEGEDSMPKHDEPLISLAADTLRGDVRDAILDWIKALPKPWSQMSESEQRDIAGAADRFSETLIKDACKHIAANERPCIVAKLTEYGEKDGVKAKLELPSKGEVVAALHEACGREVLLVTSGYEEFMGEAAAAEIQSDQPELGIGAEYEAA